MHSYPRNVPTEHVKYTDQKLKGCGWPEGSAGEWPVPSAAKPEDTGPPMPIAPTPTAHLIQNPHYYPAAMVLQ